MGFLRGLTDFGTGAAQGASAAMPQAFATMAQRDRDEEERRAREAELQARQTFEAGENEKGRVFQASENRRAEFLSTMRDATAPEELQSLLDDPTIPPELRAQVVGRHSGLLKQQNIDRATAFEEQGNRALLDGKYELSEYFLKEANRYRLAGTADVGGSDEEARNAAYGEQISADKNNKFGETFMTNVGGDMLSRILAIPDPVEREAQLKGWQKMANEAGMPHLGNLAAMAAGLGHMPEDPYAQYYKIHQMAMEMAAKQPGDEGFTESYNAAFADAQARLREHGVLPPLAEQGNGKGVEGMIGVLRGKSKPEQIKAILRALEGSPENKQMARQVMEQLGITEQDLAGDALYYDPESFRKEHPTGGGITGQPLLAPFMPTGPDDPKIKAMEQAQEQMQYSFP